MGRQRRSFSPEFEHDAASLIQQFVDVVLYRQPILIAIAQNGPNNPGIFYWRRQRSLCCNLDVLLDPVPIY